MIDRVAVAICREPIGHHEALEAHRDLQISLQEVWVRATVRAVDAVVRAHHRANAGLHCRLEGRIVQLPSRPLVNLDAVVIPVELLLVKGEVLCDTHHPLTLRATDIGRRQFGAEVGVLAGEVLEITATPRRAVHLHAGAKQYVRPFAAELAGDGRRHALDEAGVPRRRQCEHRGPRDGGSGLDASGVAKSVRGVLHLQGRQLQAVDRWRVPDVVSLLGRKSRPPYAVQEGQLLFRRHHPQDTTGLISCSLPRAVLGLRRVLPPLPVVAMLRGAQTHGLAVRPACVSKSQRRLGRNGPDAVVHGAGEAPLQKRDLEGGDLPLLAGEVHLVLRRAYEVVGRLPRDAVLCCEGEDHHA
mmetsp:Transcript_14570/g.41927  ORF Transcript_14570/g.41927 Transcript_14570/m.41927 type:complete len:356 (-) Transcript_14570:84-1151(-)